MGKLTRNSKKKKRDDYELWIYDKDWNNKMKKYTMTQGDNKYFLS